MGDTERALSQLGQTATPGMAEFLNTLKLPPKDHGYRNLLIVMQLVRDMGPDENDALWLPRPPNPHPPLLPQELEKGQGSAADDEHADADPSDGTSATPQAIVFDVKAAAALAGYLQQPSQSHRRSWHCRNNRQARDF